MVNRKPLTVHKLIMTAAVFLLALQGSVRWQIEPVKPLHQMPVFEIFKQVVNIRISLSESAVAGVPTADMGPDQSLSKDLPLGRNVILNGTASSDDDGDPLVYEWYGPFGRTAGSRPPVIMPEGVHTVSLAVHDSGSRSQVHMTTITITPCFELTALAEAGRVELSWIPAEQGGPYGIFRADNVTPLSWQKIDEVDAFSSLYIDDTVMNENTYLYVIGALSPCPGDLFDDGDVDGLDLALFALAFGSSLGDDHYNPALDFEPDDRIDELDLAVLAGDFGGALCTACYSSIVAAHPTAETLSNYSPVIYSEPLTQGTAEILYSYDLNAVDPNSDPLIYKLITGPEGMTVNPDSGLIIWMPRAVGENQVIVEVMDGFGGTDQQSFILEVTLPQSLGSPPSISNFSAPATIPFGESGLITFDYTDPEGDIKYVKINRTNILGESLGSVPRSYYDITGTSGQVSFPLETTELPFGESHFSLQLKDSGGNLSNIITFDITVVGAASGGTAPLLQDFDVLATPWNLPQGEHDRLTPLFSFSYYDPDADILRARIRIIKTTGEEVVREESASSQMITGQDGVVEKGFITFRSTDLLGIYSIELTLIDENGNMSSTESADVELVLSGGSDSPFLSGFSPQEGASGTEVIFTGGGFDFTTPENNILMFGLYPMEILEVTATSMTALIPEGAGTGPFIIRNRNGEALSTTHFSVPAAVNLSPESSEIVVNGTIQFKATVVSSGFTQVLWSVNGVVGGTAESGIITDNGLYTAPADIPAGATVTITAALINDPGIVGQSEVTILPPSPIPGQALVLSSVGGTVPSIDGRARVDIPAGALVSDTEISVTVLHGADAPPSPSDQRVVGAVKLEPSGLVFSNPVTLTLPLVRYYMPGTQLPLMFFDSDTQTFQDEGITATVAENGEQAWAAIEHFSTAALLGRFQDLGMPNPPRIDTLVPASGQEGMKVPVHITGAYLTPDLDLEILHDGNSTEDIIPGTWYSMDETGALMLDIGTITDLPAQDERDYTLRLTRPQDGATTEATFTVTGLDELEIWLGDEYEHQPGADLSGRYSQVRIDGLVSLGSDLNIESTGWVYIGGIIDGSSVPGENADGRMCGGASGEDQCGKSLSCPAPCAMEGKGGLGRNQTWGIGDPEYVNYGQSGDGPGSSSTRGGRPGFNIDLEEFILDLILGASVCIIEQECDGFLNQAIENIEDFLEGPTGEHGFGGYRGCSGGGGGGAGIFRTPPIPTGVFIETISIQVNGGGGGQGGTGASGGIEILTPDYISFGRTRCAMNGNDFHCDEGVDPSGRTSFGKINVAGGKGGDGATSSDLVLSPWPLGPDITLFEVPAFHGGGGGGGSGGDITVTSGTEIYCSDNSMEQINAKGGEGGAHGDSESRTFVVGRGRDGIRELASPAYLGDTPVFHPETLDNMVSNRSLLSDVRISYSGTDPLTVHVVGEGGANNHAQALRSGLFYTVDLVLFQGLNRIYVAGMNELMQKKVVSVFNDTDNDGLSDADELALGTNYREVDSDGDGLEDGEEILLRTDPNDPDSDDDGLTDYAEINGDFGYVTDPNKADSDEDGFSDSVEIALGTHPNEPSSTPDEIPTGTLLGASSGGTGGSYLTVVDPSTGLCGLLDRPGGGLGFGLAFNNAGRLYVATGYTLSIHDMLTGVTTDIALFEDFLGDAVSITQLAYNPTDGMLYGVEEGPPPDFSRTGQLVQIHPATAEVDRVGSEGADPIRSLAFKDDGQLLAALDQGTGSDLLVEIDPISGAVTSVGDINFAPIFGLTFTRDGDLLGSNAIDDSESRLLSIDTGNGAGTLVSTPSRALYGLTVKPCPAPCLYQPPTNPVMAMAGKTVIGDFNGDPFLDLVTEFGFASYGYGTGNFSPSQNLYYDAMEDFADAMAVGDLNNDNISDVVFAGRIYDPLGSEWKISVYLGVRPGNFSLHSAVEIPAESVFYNSDMAIADITGDGNADVLATTTGSTINDTIYVLQGDGNGNLTWAPFSFAVSAPAYQITTGDLNSDNTPDIITANSENLFIQYSDGSGGWLASVSRYPFTTAGLAVMTLAVADLNHDNDLDIAVINFIDWSDQSKSMILSVLLGNGAGGFSSPKEFSVPWDHDANSSAGDPYSLTIGDVTGDTNPDIVIGAKSVVVLIGDGIGGFSPALHSPFAVPIGALTVNLGDVNNDNLPDIVSGIGEFINVLLNQPSF